MRKRRGSSPEFKSKAVLDVHTGAQSPAEACHGYALEPDRSRRVSGKTPSSNGSSRHANPTSGVTKARSALPSRSDRMAGPHARSRFSKKPLDVYNYKRIRSLLGYLTPSEFERQWIKTQRP